MMKVLCIFLGSGIGGVLRYWLSGLVQPVGSSFPFGTLMVNVSGCFVMGVLISLWGSGPGAVREELRAAIMVGLLGGFTTFSTFGRDTLHLVQQTAYGRADAYVSSSLLLSLAATWLGAWLARRPPTP